MTEPNPYEAQHRVVALQCACQLSHLGLFTTTAEVLQTAEVLLSYLNDGSLPE